MSEIREARLLKANSLVKKGFEPYAETFKITHSTKFLTEKFGYLENGQDFNLDVALAGRVLAKRVMGKIAFYTICLLYTSDAADDLLCVDLGGRRIIKKT